MEKHTASNNNYWPVGLFQFTSISFRINQVFMLRRTNRGNGPGSTKSSSNNEIVIEQLLTGICGFSCLGVICNDFVLDINTRCFPMNNINSAICDT